MAREGFALVMYMRTRCSYYPPSPHSLWWVREQTKKAQGSALIVRPPIHLCTPASRSSLQQQISPLIVYSTPPSTPNHSYVL